MDEKALEELAVEEILKELKYGAERAKHQGALGWQKNPAPPPNKRFLHNMLVSTLRDNRPFRRRIHLDGASQHDSSHHHSTPPRGSNSEGETCFPSRDGKDSSSNRSDSKRHSQKEYNPSNRSYSYRYYPKKDSSHNGSFRDRYRQKKHRPNNESADRNESCSSSHNQKEALFSISNPEFGYSGKIPQELSPQKTEDDVIEISDSSKSSGHRRKQSKTDLSDSDTEDRNGDVKKRKKQKKKLKKNTEAEESRHWHEKKKHKKSKKSKKHKSKRPEHSSKHKL